MLAICAFCDNFKEGLGVAYTSRIEVLVNLHQSFSFK